MKKEIINIMDKIDHNEKLTSDEKKIYIDYSICKNHSGKMQGLQSISTSCLENPLCIARRASGSSICAACYAAAQLEHQKTLRNKTHYNTLFYSRYNLTLQDVPTINTRFLRIEAFGDVQNVQQCKNYYTIAKANKGVNFAIWTKNIDLYNAAGKKPSNVIMIYSIPETNMQVTKARYDLLRKYNPIIDKTFSVFTKQYADAENITINCGGRACASCLRCYTRKGDKIINELKK